MTGRILVLLCLCLSLGAVNAPVLSADDDYQSLWEALAGGGHAVLMRHATAPGDDNISPDDLSDCSQQRQLSEQGWDEARRMGALFRRNGLDDVPVYTSEYCRCRQTAEALALGEVTLLPALNRFFYERELADERLAAVTSKLREHADGPSIILVSHGLTIFNLTGQRIDSGDMLIVHQPSYGKLEVVGRISAGIGSRSYGPSAP